MQKLLSLILIGLILEQLPLIGEPTRNENPPKKYFESNLPSDELGYAVLRFVKKYDAAYGVFMLQNNGDFILVVSADITQSKGGISTLTKGYLYSSVATGFEVKQSGKWERLGIGHDARSYG